MKLVQNFLLAIGLVQANSLNYTRFQYGSVPEMRVTGSGTYDSGAGICLSWDMLPLSIHNMETATAAFNLCQTNGGTCYIGLLRSTDTTGPTWEYDDGTQYDFTAWDSGQPQSDETRVTIYTPGNNAQSNWHDWGTGDSIFPMICGQEFVSESPQPSNSPMVSPSQSDSPSLSPSTTSTASNSLSASNTAGVCNPYCVGEYGKCQNPVEDDFTCYPFDDMGNCPVGTVSCPTAIEADTITICENCVMDTSGPCQDADNGRCDGFRESGVCAPNLVYCEAF